MTRLTKVDRVSTPAHECFNVRVAELDEAACIVYHELLTCIYSGITLITVAGCTTRR